MGAQSQGGGGWGGWGSTCVEASMLAARRAGQRASEARSRACSGVRSGARSGAERSGARCALLLLFLRIARRGMAWPCAAHRSARGRRASHAWRRARQRCTARQARAASHAASRTAVRAAARATARGRCGGRPGFVRLSVACVGASIAHRGSRLCRAAVLSWGGVPCLICCALLAAASAGGSSPASHASFALSIILGG